MLTDINIDLGMRFLEHMSDSDLHDLIDERSLCIQKCKLLPQRERWDIMKKKFSTKLLLRV